MKKDPIDVLLRRSIDTFVEEMNVLVRQAAVEAVSDALGTSAPVGRNLTSRTSRIAQPKSGKRVRRSLAELEKMADKIERFIKANPGSKMDEISASLRATTKELRRPLQFLHEANRIKTKGQKRGMQYFASGAGKAVAPPSMPKPTAKNKQNSKSKKKAGPKRGKVKASAGKKQKAVAA